MPQQASRHLDVRPLGDDALDDGPIEFPLDTRDFALAARHPVLEVPQLRGDEALGSSACRAPMSTTGGR